MDIKTSKGIAQSSNEQLRRWTDRGWEQAAREGNYDRSRGRLNFEIVRGGIVKPVDKTRSLPQRMADNLRARGIKDPNEGLAEPRFRTVVNIIFGGSRERMRELAFGDQQVNYDRGADNSSVERRQEIEQWAKDIYDFVCGKWGEENIAAFIVHLDETNPHIHCSLLPIKDGRFAFKKLFAGNDILDFKRKSIELHNELAKVNEKWGLTRGSNISETGAKHRSTEDYRRWLNDECTTLEERVRNHRKALSDLSIEISIAEKKHKSFSTMVANLHAEKEQLSRQIASLQTEMQSGQSDHKQLAAQVAALQKQLATTEAKLADKEGKLSETEQKLATLRADLATLTEEAKRLTTTANDMEEKARASRLDWSHSMAYHLHTTMLEQVVSEFTPRMRQMAAVNQEMFDGTLISELAATGNKVITVAMLLMCNAVDNATTFAETHGGGGGSPSSGWGRDPDEDDRLWARRCLAQARQMMQPRVAKKKKV